MVTTLYVQAIAHIKLLSEELFLYNLIILSDRNKLTIATTKG